MQLSPLQIRDITNLALIKKLKDYIDEKVNLSKGDKGDCGDDGYTPIKGKDYFDGKDYILTKQDKKEIVQSIKVPIIEKVIEKTEIIKEQPIVKSEIIEVAIYEEAEQIKEKIKLQEELDKLREEMKQAIQIIPRGRIGMKKITSVRSYDLTSSVNGVTKTFTLPNDTLKVLGVWGTQFPVTFNENVDWTFSGRTLTLTDVVSAPEAGQTLWALIETQFYA